MRIKEWRRAAVSEADVKMNIMEAIELCKTGKIAFCCYSPGNTHFLGWAFGLLIVLEPKGVWKPYLDRDVEERFAPTREQAIGADFIEADWHEWRGWKHFIETRDKKP